MTGGSKAVVTAEEKKVGRSSLVLQRVVRETGSSWPC
jgi:predicted metal-dependent phosphotriesterase family hydrolase